MFYDRELKREFEFLTNIFEMRPDLVSAIYKLRWQIELLQTTQTEFSTQILSWRQ